MVEDRRKFNGRKPGTLTKKTLDLMSELEKHHFDIVHERMRVFKEAMKTYERGDQDRVSALSVADGCIKDLMKYVYPQRKAVELSGKDGDPIALTFTQLMKQAVEK